MTLIRSETRETYITAGTPHPAPPDPVDILFLKLRFGKIDLAAAAQRVRELIGAAEVASANDARASWVNDEPTGLFDDDDDDRCPYCGARDGACSH